MNYKSFKDINLSALGFGTMRLPTVDGKPTSPVDEAEANRILKYAYDHGVNYFDTAYPYHRGESERIIGRFLKQFKRDSYYLATKFPGHEVRATFDPKAIFEEQLEKCGVDYFDFYLLHNVYENSIKTYTNKDWNIVEYLLEQKKNGRIKHLGFSVHGRIKTLKEFLDIYGSEMEFCQMQLNYLDWTLQEAEAKYNLLTERKIPIWVMEPVRGGKLATLSPENTAKLEAKRPDESVASWAFRWLESLPNVNIILSGMSNMEQVQDNIETFSEGSPLNEEEIKLLDEVAASMLDLIPCTACRYCIETCPQKLDIPTLLAFANECRFAPAFSASMAIDSMQPEERPTACIACGKCTEACPQSIDVPKAMQEFQAVLDKLPHWADMRR